jgi:hypothetical protein
MIRAVNLLFLLASASLLPAPSIAAVPDAATAQVRIKQTCAEDFPDNYSTQAYCIKTNREGYATFVDNRAKARPILIKSYELCQSDFGDEGKWSTAAYCAKTHTEGYDEYMSLKATASAQLLRAYAKCERDFGDEGKWSTTAYCAKQERDAYRELGN